MGRSIIGDHSVETIDVNSSSKSIAANHQLERPRLKLVQHLAAKRLIEKGDSVKKMHLSSALYKAVKFTSGMPKICEQ